MLAILRSPGVGPVHARDIPVLGGLIDSVLVFAATLGRIVRHPFGFVRTIAFDDPHEPARAFKFIGAGIALAYLILTPALSRHGFAVGELVFGVVVLLRLLLIAVVYHAAFLVAGYRRPVMTSLILASYINGIYFPFFMATVLPAYLVMGPHSYFDPLAGRLLSPQQIQDLDAPLVRGAQIMFLVGYLFFYALTAYWWAKAYGTKIWLSAALLLVTLALAALANLYILPFAIRPLL